MSASKVFATYLYQNKGHASVYCLASDGVWFYQDAAGNMRPHGTSKFGWMLDAEREVFGGGSDKMSEKPRPIGTSEVVTCGVCGGSGKSWWLISGVVAVCSDCNGTGKIKRTVVAHKVTEVIKEEPADGHQ